MAFLVCTGGKKMQLAIQTQGTAPGQVSPLSLAETAGEPLKQKPRCPLNSREAHPADTLIRVGAVTIGGDSFAVIAGPCSVESQSQLLDTAREVQRHGATLLRGGAFKPRTSPYSFQGLGPEGLDLLRLARQVTGLPIVTEVMDSSELAMVAEVADVIQVGARNVQNFALLKAVGRVNKPVLLKRGLMTTVSEFLSSAEYILAAGNPEVILCERGIRTFETAVRNTLDLSVVPVLKERTHLPVIVDPSHAVGKRRFVEPLARAALAVGADGIMVEVHVDPEHALCDGEQSLTPAEFASMMTRLRPLAPLCQRVIC
ncbi:MAG: 3-deoxy-7-phosphoheptulonate synthase [Deltaproteobacteria bacterium]|nr:3-deoxy-7-phosphoheptulonate synthase [Deltaproteobacteria bacterium]